MYENESQIFEKSYVVYAGFWTRFAAAFIDGLVLSPVSIINFLINRTVPGQGLAFLTFFIGVVASWLYEALMISSSSQATIGKRTMGIKVVSVHGHTLSFGQATGRHFAKILSSLIICIGYFMMLWDERSQTLHDKLAGCLVVTEGSMVSVVS